MSGITRIKKSLSYEEIAKRAGVKLYDTKVELTQTDFIKIFKYMPKNKSLTGIRKKTNEK